MPPNHARTILHALRLRRDELQAMADVQTTWLEMSPNAHAARSSRDHLVMLIAEIDAAVAYVTEQEPTDAD